MVDRRAEAERLLDEHDDALAEYQCAPEGDTCERARYRKSRAAVLAAMTVPTGYKLVPVEPTKEMRAAFHKAHLEYEQGGPSCPDHQWAAMLAAAPEVPR